MNTRYALSPLLRNLISTLLLVGVGSLAADQPPAAPPAPSREMREQMAAVHERMAACLRSDQAFAACRDEMWKNCQSMMGQGCPMMGMGMQDHMMKQ